MKERILITESSDMILEKMQEYLPRAGQLCHVTIYFENSNFLITKYRLLSYSVHMILEMDNLEFQIVNANCGYLGTGPICSVKILRELGLKIDELDTFFYSNKAISFSVDKELRIYDIDTEQLFYNRAECKKEDEKKMINKIRLDKNVNLIMKEKLIRMFNPQRTNYNGLINLLGYADEFEIEYYLGNESVLDNGLHISSYICNQLSIQSSGADLDGIDHCNLYIKTKNFNISCFIDRTEEITVINMIYYSITGKMLITGKRSFKDHMLELITGKEKEDYDKVIVTQKREKLRYE